MGSFRFTKRIRLAPGLTLNVNKKSLSLTAGARGAHATYSTNGTRTLSAGIPGTGLSYRDTRKIAPAPAAAAVSKTRLVPGESGLSENLPTAGLTEVSRTELPSGAEVVLLRAAPPGTPPSWHLYVHDPGHWWDFVGSYSDAVEAYRTVHLWDTYLRGGGSVYAWWNLSGAAQREEKS